MKIPSGERKYAIKIEGDELDALKIVCADMPESFGLDRRIEAYKGTRPIGFYRWDLDGLVDTFDFEIKHASKQAARKPASEVRPAVAISRRIMKRRGPTAKPSAVASLRDRLKALRDKAYEELEIRLQRGR